MKKLKEEQQRRGLSFLGQTNILYIQFVFAEKSNAAMSECMKLLPIRFS